MRLKFTSFIDNTAISSWGYFGFALLFSIPVIGTLTFILCAFLARNINVRNFARAFCIIYVAMLIVFAVLALTVYLLGIELPFIA